MAMGLSGNKKLDQMAMDLLAGDLKAIGLSDNQTKW